MVGQRFLGIWLGMEQAFLNDATVLTELSTWKKELRLQHAKMEMLIGDSSYLTLVKVSSSVSMVFLVMVYISVIKNEALIARLVLLTIHLYNQIGGIGVISATLR
ncbi:hypothetical protein D3C75_898050 [compost metagenome]